MRGRIAAVAIALMAVSLVSILGWAADTKASGVTYTKDVAPILQKNCMTCHRPGNIGPMPLTSYDEARPWAKAIREAVAARKMPPWHADARPGVFENDPRLSQKEIDTIVSWADGGTRQGESRHEPKNPAFPEGWSLGQPDLVFSLPEAFTVPADGVVPYKYFVVPTNFKEDTWIQAAEIRPGNRSVVHHVIVFVRDPGATGVRDPQAGADDRSPEGVSRRQEQRIREGRLDAMLVGTAPGMPAFAFKPGQGKLIKAGSNLVFQMHYTPTGSVEKDQTSVGLTLAKAPAERAVMTFGIAQSKFKIPPGEPNHEVKSSFSFPDDARVLSLMPHMHVRGKDFKYTAVYPDGREQVLLAVKWDFNWQNIYRFKEPVFMPKGSRIDCVAHFDNSPNNKHNPDPTKEVYWGDQTWEEMMIGWMDFVLDKPPAGKTATGGND